MRKINKIALLTVLAPWIGTAFATMPLEKLEAYDYGSLYLVRVIQQKNDGSLACFVTTDNKVVWVRQGAYIGKKFGTLKEIGEGFVVVSEKIQVNGGEWIERAFKWPLTERKDLTGRCESPPKQPV